MHVERLDDGLSTPAAGPTRVEICPPALQGPLGWRRKLLDWLIGSWPADEFEPVPSSSIPPAADSDALEGVRNEFVTALQGIASRAATDLAWRIRGSHSLRELWHLRTELFNLVACSAGQAEATARLQPLNRHFPARAPRSGFGRLDTEWPGRRT